MNYQNLLAGVLELRAELTAPQEPKTNEEEYYLPDNKSSFRDDSIRSRLELLIYALAPQGYLMERYQKMLVIGSGTTPQDYLRLVDDLVWFLRHASTPTADGCTCQDHE